MRRHSTYERVMLTILVVFGLVIVGFVVRAFVAPTTSFEKSITIKASVDDVWPFLVDEDKRVEWQVGARTVVNLMGGELMVGARSIIVHKANGQQWEIEEEVIDLVPAKLFSVVQSADDYVENLTIALEMHDNSVDLLYRSSKLRTSFKDKLFAPWLSYHEAQAVAQSLQHLKEKVETQMQ